MDGVAQVFAAWLGAWGTFLTVVITVGGAMWVAFWQLGHDRTERAKDRALQAKREVLMECTKAALVAVQAVGDLSQLGTDVQKTSEKLGDALAKINAGSAVASIEVMTCGKNLVEAVRKQFMNTIVARALLGEATTTTIESQFSLDVIRSQKQLQEPFVLLVAAVRRDLGIEGSGDKEVREALWIDLDALEQHTRETLRALTG
ncbi:hypothetical protein [Stenotrophomonas bentonitica]|uniref:Uncharacterized protein n=1 Tax=Stenotrophomonas bentonitica TaxID=1450134 RepID=A0ABU9JRY7_9GAMM